MRPRQRRAMLAFTLLVGVPAAVNGAVQERPDEDARRYVEQAVQAADSFVDRFDAEVWLVDMETRLKGRVEDPDERLRILRHAHREASRANLNPELVLAVIDVESNFDRFALSVAGARGLMQVMPFWKDEIGRPEDNLFHINTNLRYGCSILRYYLDMERGNVSRALARYNGSLGKTWYPSRVFRALRLRWYAN